MPKNPGLEYEAQVPTFLQRLKAGEAERDGRHNVSIPRARGVGRNSRLDMQGEDGEDDPLMLDEDGNEISKEEMEAMQKPKQEVTAKGEEKADGEPQRKVEEKVSSGFGKKRKAVKVVGDEKGDEVERDDVKATKSSESSTNDLKSVVSEGKEKARKDVDAKKKKKKKKKRQKVNLSFDEPD